MKVLSGPAENLPMSSACVRTKRHGEIHVLSDKSRAFLQQKTEESTVPSESSVHVHTDQTAEAAGRPTHLPHDSSPKDHAGVLSLITSTAKSQHEVC